MTELLNTEKLDTILKTLIQQQELLAHNQHQLVRMCLDLQAQIEQLRPPQPDDNIH